MHATAKNEHDAPLRLVITTPRGKVIETRDIAPGYTVTFALQPGLRFRCEAVPPLPPAGEGWGEGGKQ